MSNDEIQNTNKQNTDKQNIRHNDNKQTTDSQPGNKYAPPVLPIDTPETGEQQGGLLARMQSVKAEWDKAQEGEKKTRALKHYQSAEQARRSGNEDECIYELDQASRALA